MTVPSQGEPCHDINAWEMTIEASLQTRKKLAQLMDQIDETVVVLRAEIEHAKIRRGDL